MTDAPAHPSDPKNDGAQFDLLTTWSRAYRAALYKFFAKRILVGTDSEDMVQEVFLRLARQSDLGRIERPEGYLFQTAYSVLHDWRRRGDRRPGVSLYGAADDVCDDSASPERAAIARDYLNYLIGVLDQLNETTKTVFVLYHFENQTHLEISRGLGMAVRTVEDHMARANRALSATKGDAP